MKPIVKKLMEDQIKKAKSLLHLKQYHQKSLQLLNEMKSQIAASEPVQVTSNEEKTLEAERALLKKKIKDVNENLRGYLVDVSNFMRE